MVFSEEDKTLIKNLYPIKGYGPRRLMSEFPGKGWKRPGLYELLARTTEYSMVTVERGLCVTNGEISMPCVVVKGGILNTKGRLFHAQVIPRGQLTKG